MSQRRQCELCAESFERADELAEHWFRDHNQKELSSSELRAALAEDRRQQYAHSFEVDVDVTIPSETWEFVCEREDVDPAEAEPEDIADVLHDLLSVEFDFEVESSKGDATKYHA